MSGQSQGNGAVRTDFVSSDSSLIPVRLLTREHPPAGAHIAHVGRGDDGAFYYCKDDRSGLPIRMREAIFSQLAQAVGIPTPGFRIVEDAVSGETYFGSRRHLSTADDDERKKFLRTESKNEFGKCSPFPGGFFSQLSVFDTFINNPDRSADNIVAIREGQTLRLCPIDFAAAELSHRPVDHFPVEGCETVQVARLLRTVHGFSNEAARDQMKRLEAVSLAVFKGFFGQLPADWVNVIEKEALCDLWAGDGVRRRLDALGTGIADGTLL